GGVISAVVFFVLGQASLVVIARSYEKIVRFPIIELINRRNNSAGLLLAMTLIAYGLLVSRSISGSFTGWTADLTDFGFSMLTGFALIALLQWPLERIFLTNSDLKTEVVRDDNVAGVLVITTVRLALFAAVAFVAV
ncbi:MAG TPA: DUF350 domain-containing protein, partial [Candidatus Paceibacterota bacterium]|nr:DUF350 domain-containing protein [Candidatus Paceibacterota bacterium]